MSYIPGARKTENKAESSSGSYIPASKIMSGNSKTTENSGQNLAQPSFIASDLQKLIDEHIEKEKDKKEEKEKEESVSPVECWNYLRSERNKLLRETDNVNFMGTGLSFDERGRLYAYRQALRDLPAQKGAPWTPSTIPWPIQQ